MLYNRKIKRKHFTNIIKKRVRGKNGLYSELQLTMGLRAYIQHKVIYTKGLIVRYIFLYRLLLYVFVIVGKKKIKLGGKIFC